MSTTHQPTTTDQITATYKRLVNRPRGWVSLTALRRELAHIDRADLDEGLRLLHRSPGGNLIPESNQKTLTGEDRAAALRLGGEWKHLLSIEG